MAGFRLIDLAKPLQSILPEIELPYENIPFDDKLIYTFVSALVYILCQFPLASISKEHIDVKDPIFFLRNVFASETKTLMEFGLFPLISSSLILQLMAGLRLIDINFKIKSDRQLFQTLTKFLAIVQYIILANIFIFAGYYGSNLSPGQILNLNIQLIGSGIFTTLLCEIVDKGYGFVSGIMTINTVVIATTLVSDALAFNQIAISDSDDTITEAQGAIINLIQSLRASHRTLMGNIVSVFSRDYLPNLSSVLLCILVGVAVAYLHNIRIELPIRSTRARGMNNMYPVRLLNIGCLSILFSYVILFFIHIIAFVFIQLIAKNDPSHIICKIIGHYEVVNNYLYVPTFPLSLLTPPRSIQSMIFKQPLTIIVFPLFLATTGVWFASKWQAISGSSAKDIANDFKEQGITLTGRREQNIAKELEKTIPTASTTGAAVLALTTAVGEFLGLKGQAAGMVVGVCGAFAILEFVTLEYQQSGGQSMLAQVLGGAASAFQ
ncbi:hypothetical protein TBLA_0C02600 [Henningerozyma blattae CBS 6284]|uniref:Translocon Sec61/SecY plug domain-containing protein n=1 Tax=Henningerozyma blattae (strain ATCC 34711 / CBS 6284 / DSM 70876 / NBRC 10599 / NRRL Y-10934 / UCD 77-7) TaxID=1071380 RepID=I2H117_HENB6|nr:hypothetical protein TBLA_0C02600 [Tetrapisispora blattae CBS 6284]CCH60069.1 hypothetical protein TBLA_0C02600 [Tetrapisispora blattae CBS 6284]